MKVTLKELLEAGCHFGHQTIRWHPKMKPYIFAAQDGVHIIDLEKTREGLIAAGEFLGKVIKDGGKVLFVGTKRQAKKQILEIAQKFNQPYVVDRWLGGTLTNWDQIKKRIDKLFKMKKEREEGEYKKFTKKERLLLSREIARLEQFFGGISSLEGSPDALFVVDAKKERIAVREALQKGVPIVAVCDTNADPSEIDRIIPSNDDAEAAIKLVLEKLEKGILEAQEKKAKKKTAKKKTKKAKKKINKAA